MTPPVTRKPGYSGGRYCVAFTGVTVRTVVGFWLGGASIAEIVRQYPHLTPLQIENALRWWSQRTKPLRVRILRGKA